MGYVLPMILKTAARSLVFGLALISLVGCGGSFKNESSQTELNYSYSVNGCKTGSRSAASSKGYCENLANNKLNNYCAQAIREDAFKRANCASLGVEWNPIDAEGTVPKAVATPATPSQIPDGAESAPPGYTYSMSVNDCETGSHTAATKKGYCENLANDSLNNDCARGLRRQVFDRDECAAEGLYWN